MPSTSKTQQRTMQAAAHNPAFAAKVGIPQKVAADFNDADKAAGNVGRAADLPARAPAQFKEHRARRGIAYGLVLALALLTLPALAADSPQDNLFDAYAPLKPAAGTTATIAVGGTAVTLFSGPSLGGYIVNPYNAAAQGISVAETAYIDMVGTPGSTDAAASGTTATLVAGQVFNVPRLAADVSVKANAATSGHILTVVQW